MEELTKIKILLITIALLITSFTIILLSTQSNITGEVIKSNTYSYTKAFCNENNFCIDYYIVCKDNNPVTIRPTNSTAKFPDNWEDPRSQEDKDKLC